MSSDTMEEASQPVHYRSLDVLKGMIMVVIVFGHVMITARDGGSEGGGMPVIVQALYLGLMAFFIMSGYFYRPGRGFVESITKRAKQILIPLFLAVVLLPLILFVYLNILGYGLPISDYIEAVIWGSGWSHVFEPLDSYIVDAVSQISWGLYFLFVMFWAFIIFYALADRVVNDTRKAVAVIAILLVIQALMVEFIDIRLPMHLNKVPIAAAFMFAGALLARTDYFNRLENGKKDARYFLLPVISLAAGIGLCYVFQPNIVFDKGIFGSYGGWSVFPYFIEALLIFIPITYIGYAFSLIPKVSDAFAIIGRHTLGIILLHPLVGRMIAGTFVTINANQFVPDEVGVVARIALAIVTIIICVLICEAIPRVLDRIKGLKKKDDAEPGQS